MMNKISKSLGIYIHIPFCIKKCNYCDFCSFPGTGEAGMEAYADRVCEKLASYSEVCRPYLVDSVYFGGGTPTLLPIRLFKKMMDTLRASFRLSDDAEITAECNPATADKAYFRGLLELGVNRLSIGLQSASDRELALLGRCHSFADFKDTYRDAREAGFGNISLDLMYGLPDSELDDLRYSLGEVIALAPEHISAYGLKLEEGTPFYALTDSPRIPDDDLQFEMYSMLSRELSGYGYEKYEISNFARDGRYSRHNMKYWQGGEYLGIGVAAHSFFGGERFGNSRDMEGFLAGRDIECERYAVDESESLAEYVMLSLRLSRGLDLDEYHRRTGTDIFCRFPEIKSYMREGYMESRDGRLFFTDKGFFVSNAILSALTDL